MATKNNLEVNQDSINKVIANIENYNNKMRAGLLLISKEVAKRMEVWAKDSAPWTDRTTNARRGLVGDADWKNVLTLVVTMSHTVDYGPMLELAYERKYAVLERALDAHRDEFLEQWAKIITGVEGGK